MKLIGKGCFSKVYEVDADRVKIVSTDMAKECLALWGFGDSPLWPVLERIDQLDSGENVFIGKRYKTGRGVKGLLNARSYRLYLALRKCGDCYFQGRNEFDAAQHLRTVFRSMPEEFSEEREAMCAAVDSLLNYGHDVRFEISPRNVAADNAGGLILLDVFFFRSARPKVKIKW